MINQLINSNSNYLHIGNYLKKNFQEFKISETAEQWQFNTNSNRISINSNNALNLNNIDKSIDDSIVTSIYNSDEISLYPNPNNGSFKIKGANNISQLIIIDVLGNEIYKTNSNENNNFINIQLNDGIYLVKIIYSGDKIEMFKINILN